MCARLVQNNNGTPSDPTDDVVAGECQTLFVPVGASGCGDRRRLPGARRTARDTCDAAHGLCYRQGGRLRLALYDGRRLHAGRNLLEGHALPRRLLPDLRLLAEPGAPAGVDVCAGAGSACVQRGGPDAPIRRLLRRVLGRPDAGALMRLRDGIRLRGAGRRPPASICLGQNGT